MLADLTVEHRLREHRLVDLVVPVLAVADQLDDNIRLERLAPLGRQLEDLDHILHVIAVHVEHRDVEACRGRRRCPFQTMLLALICINPLLGRERWAAAAGAAAAAAAAVAAAAAA